MLTHNKMHKNNINRKDKNLTKSKLKRNTHKNFDKTLLKQLNSTPVKPATFLLWKKKELV